MYWEIEAPPKLLVFQAIVAKLLMCIFQRKFYAGLPADGALGQIVAVANYFHGGKHVIASSACID